MFKLLTLTGPGRPMLRQLAELLPTFTICQFLVRLKGAQVLTLSKKKAAFEQGKNVIR